MLRKQWRWRLRDGYNRLIIGASTEGYNHKGDLTANLLRVTGIYLDHNNLTGTSTFVFHEDDKSQVRGVVIHPVDLP